jgi:cytochrome bd ubiquinol oxidase subunit II
MLTVIACLLGLALILYAVLGGADFGAGILEIVSGRRHQATIADAIAPVWEANHVWLILVVVVLFVGFPAIYATLSLLLHLPLLLALLGIVLRGTAFACRHYDVAEAATHRYYGAVFRYASLLTPLFMGMALGATMLGRLNPEAPTFGDRFLWPWLNGFACALGVFTIALFAYVAAVFLIGETSDPAEQHLYRRYARYALGAAVGTGGVVFLAAHLDGLPLLWLFWRSPVSLACLILATLLIPVLLPALARGQIWRARLLVGTQVGLILLGWFAVQYPVIIRLQGRPDLTLLNTRAPDGTLLPLLIAVMVGVAVVMPALGYLFWVFKVKR